MSMKRGTDLAVVPGGARSGWDRLVGDFEASAQASGLSFRTVEHYSDVLRRVLLGYCEREGVEPTDLTKRHLEHMSAELLQAGRSRQSVKTYMSAINRFLRWCSEEGELARLRGPEPRVERRLLDVLGRDEINRIEEAAATERDKLIVRVLADTGIRVGELRRLRVTDLVSQGLRALPAGPREGRAGPAGPDHPRPVHSARPLTPAGAGPSPTRTCCSSRSNAGRPATTNRSRSARSRAW